MIFSAKYSYKSLVSKKVSYDGVWLKFQKIIFSFFFRRHRRRRWAAGRKIFFRQNFPNIILGKVRKFGSPVISCLEDIKGDILPRVILTPPPVVVGLSYALEVFLKMN